jgi:Tfp pilus assembly protein PilW
MATGAIADECGMTVIEVMVAAVVGLIVAGAAMAFLITSLDNQNTVASRASANRQAEAGLERMVSDLRQAMSQDASGNALTATVATSAAAGTTSLVLDVPNGTDYTTYQQVTWTCPSGAQSSANIGTCYRKAGTTGVNQPLITGVQSVSFVPVDSSGVAHTLSTSADASYADPASVAITLELQVVSQLDNSGSHLARGSSSLIPVSTTVDLRNFA